MAKVSEKLLVLGVPIHLVDNYLEWLVARLQEKRGAHVVTLNSEMTIEADKNADLLKIISAADLVVPDGSGIVFYCWLHGRPIDRCPGIELAEALLTAAGDPEKAWPVFFFGSAPGVAETAAKTWQQRIRGLEIAGTHDGFLSPATEVELKHTLKELQPPIIMVGLGAPRQEFWIAENRSLCPNSIWIGVGGSLDIWAGIKSRAPDWFCDHHLEWLYRLYKEPWRWRRMLALPQFAGRAIADRLLQGRSVVQ
ncbi:MAG: WecB/TagA/CpsF family glycosyltransferase [Leptolyngbyaceae bacterium]|nr:WecB/TagA/CpsF family glycosyltransferase [Leptolyngbyaceae bacterium]